TPSLPGTCSRPIRSCRRFDERRGRQPGRLCLMQGWIALPRSWLDSLGEIARFGGSVMGQVYSGRVLRFFGESLRQAGILILGSALVIWGLVFISGLQCGL